MMISSLLSHVRIHQTRTVFQMYEYEQTCLLIYVINNTRKEFIKEKFKLQKI